MKKTAALMFCLGLPLFLGAQTITAYKPSFHDVMKEFKNQYLKEVRHDFSVSFGKLPDGRQADIVTIGSYKLVEDEKTKKAKRDLAREVKIFDLYPGDGHPDLIVAHYKKQSSSFQPTAVSVRRNECSLESSLEFPSDARCQDMTEDDTEDFYNEFKKKLKYARMFGSIK
ncbi:hypothetical protein JXB27_02865 [Candidatus Woesearchaeota archaeon]|nr:hypothetical protein [Candidatus Woesearchaeota archaeon]